MLTTARSAFKRLAGRPDDAIDLAEGALLIARDEYPELDLAACRAQLDVMGDALRPRVEAAGANPFAIIDALGTYLFRELGFRGNTEDYFDPRNSYLNDVLERRRGIPITLSIVTMTVAARAGVRIEGVSFPGHFLVRYANGERHVLIDPFHFGAVLLPDDCRRRLKETFGRPMPLEERYFQTATPRQILVRVLGNLKHIYWKRRDHERTLRVIDRMLALKPGDPQSIRDRGVVHLRLAQLGSAASDLETYVRLAPGADDAEKVRRQIRSIRRLTAMLN
jgi:regulator of sirC expression with transglutaminase-like and TPR domain